MARSMALMAAVLVVAAGLLGDQHVALAMPAYAGGLSNPVVPLDISKFNPPAPTQAGMAPSDVGCPPTDGTIPLYIPDPDSCTKYTVCSGPFGMEMECAPGMHFSVKTSSCTFPPLAGCPLLENATETISFTDLKGPPGIDATAYPMGIPSRDGMKSGPSGNMGQLPDLSFISKLAPESKSGLVSTGTPPEIAEVDSLAVDITTEASLIAKILGFMSGGSPSAPASAQGSVPSGASSSDSAGDTSGADGFAHYIDENLPQPKGATTQGSANEIQPAHSSEIASEANPPAQLPEKQEAIAPTEKTGGLLSKLRRNKSSKTTI